MSIPSIFRLIIIETFRKSIVYPIPERLQVTRKVIFEKSSATGVDGMNFFQISRLAIHFIFIANSLNAEMDEENAAMKSAPYNLRRILSRK